MRNANNLKANCYKCLFAGHRQDRQSRPAAWKWDFRAKRANRTTPG